MPRAFAMACMAVLAGGWGGACRRVPADLPASDASPGARASEPPAAPTAAGSPAAGGASPQADGTRRYAVVFFVKGPRWAAARAPAEAQRLDRAHQDLARRLVDEGRLAAYGPIEGDGALRALAVSAESGHEPARAAWAEDEAIVAGRLALALQTFVGTPGIGRRLAEERRQAGGRDVLLGYHVVLLRRGPRFDPGETGATRALARARVSWMSNLERSAQLVLAGPFVDGQPYTGLMALRGASLERAQLLVRSDPIVMTQRYAQELHTWWLPRGVLE